MAERGEGRQRETKIFKEENRKLSGSEGSQAVPVRLSGKCILE
jgi:hypothetical protein